jgi:hypothetical protein
MAKKSKKAKQSKKSAQQPPSAPPRNPIYMGLLSLLLGGWIIWRLEPSVGLGQAIMWGVLAALAWAIFVLAFSWSQRRGGDND